MSLILFIVAAVIFALNALKVTAIDPNWGFFLIAAGLAFLSVVKDWIPRWR